MSSDNLPVFRFVDGVLQRVPGDVMDPSRRYGGVSDSTGSYIREFTQAEEQEADEMARRWEEEQPQREAEERKQKEEAERFRESLVYERRVVVFLDVLGWADALERSANDPEYAKELGVVVNGLQSHVQYAAAKRNMFAGSFPNTDPQATQFSDSIVFSFRSSNDRHEREWLKSELTGNLMMVTNQLLHARLLVRGGIAEGPVIHREGLVYGPALVEAYRLESTRAFQPRIILSDELAEEWGPGARLFDQIGNLVRVDEPWRRDTDGKYFYNFLLSPWAHIATPDILSKQFKPWHQFITSGLKQWRDDLRKASKYLWLARYYNRACDAFPNATLERISLDECLS